MPESVEVQIARLDQKVEDLRRQVTDVVHVAPSVAELKTDISYMRATMDGYHTDLQDLRTTLAERDKAVSDERRSTRIALWSLVGVLGASIITGAAAVLAALV
jgi:hypothetical protein